MITLLNVKNFPAVPYLETSHLMQNHPEGVVFSRHKPNVIVGPNGAGKSACLKALALSTLSYYGGVSALDNHYVGLGKEAESYWDQAECSWRRQYQFLPGLTCEEDRAPALYYRPSHIPGNDHSVAASMMCGYFQEARRYGELTEDKSSGQQSRALLERVYQALAGDTSEIGYTRMNWRFGKELLKDEALRRAHSFDLEAEALKKRLMAVADDAIPLILMDEPEQSLDAKAELQLWQRIVQADMARLQVIVASHSLYPLMHPDQFHIIEAVPGYLDEVRTLL